MPVAALLSACGTQWRVGFGGPYGLDYPAVFAVAAALGIPITPDTVRGIGIVERTQLELWNKDGG